MHWLFNIVGDLNEVFRPPVPADFDPEDDVLKLPHADGFCQSIPKRIVDFVTARTPDPWPATTRMTRYFSFALRAEFFGCKAGRRWDWVLQIDLSGCGGEGEISAMVGQHWAALWFEAHRDELRNEFSTFGFCPREDQPELEGASPSYDRPLFAPTIQHGYLAYFGEQPPYIPEDDPDPPSGPFWGSTCTELDHEAVHDLVKSGADISNACSVDRQLHELFADRRCRCQLCMPALDLSQVPDLPAALTRFS